MRLGVALVTFLFAQTALGPAWQSAQAQTPQIVEDYRLVMEIPSISDMESSPLHLYVLSQTDGLVVFRHTPDSLLWLYSSTGMQRRGDRLSTDARFAYLYGNGTRLSVIEPTSVLGVYSSTTLPTIPSAVARTGQLLWIALGDKGLGMLSLKTRASVDSTLAFPLKDALNKDEAVRDVVSDPTSTLYVLQGMHSLHLVRLAQADSVRYGRKILLDRDMDSIHLVEGRLFGSTRDGQLFRIMVTGQTQFVADFANTIDEVFATGERLIVRTMNAKIWIGSIRDGFSLIKKESDAGNHIAISHHGIHLSQYDRLTKVMVIAGAAESGTSNALRTGQTGQGAQAGQGTLAEQGTQAGQGAEGGQNGEPATGMPGMGGDEASRDLQPELRPIADFSIPYPKPVIVPIELSTPIPHDQVEFTLLSAATNASIRGRSLLWQPAANQVGRTRFTILATSSTGRQDSTSFTVHVRPFNEPPRFAPVRPMTIPVGERFEYTLLATDPDGLLTDLIRYLGVDIPDGASFNETSATFRWTPTLRQVGTHTFKVIATDQFGSAASATITLTVSDQITPGDG